MGSFVVGMEVSREGTYKICAVKGLLKKGLSFEPIIKIRGSIQKRSGL